MSDGCDVCARPYEEHNNDCVTYLRKELDELRTRVALLEAAIIGIRYNAFPYQQPEYWQNPVIS